MVRDLSGRIGWGSGALLLFLVSGCASATARPGLLPPPPPGSGQVQAGDRFEVAYWIGDQELRFEAPVEPHGSITLPRLGEVPVSGLSGAEGRDAIRARYAERILDTPVRVRYLRRVAIQGEVRGPGLYWIDEAVDLRQALALAGGIPEVGDESRIYLIRGTDQYLVPTGAGGGIPAIPIRSGDEIQVGRRSWISRNVPYVVSTGISIAGVIAAVIVGGR